MYLFIREKHINFIVIVVIVSIILSGATILSYFRIPRIFLGGLVGIFLLTVKNWRKFTFKLERNNIFLLVWIFFLGISIFFSYYRANTLKQFCIFASIFFLINIVYTDEEINLMITLVEVITMVYAISIVLECFLPNQVIGLIGKLSVNPPEFLYSEIAEGQYSGLVGERALAAYFMNIAICVQLSVFLEKRRFTIKSLLFLMIYVLALMLTGKRTLFLIALVQIVLLIHFSDVKNKYVKTIGFLLILLPVAVIVISVVPQARVVFERFQSFSAENSESGSALNGREFFWNYCKVMYSRRPVFGYGLDTFNEAFADEIHYVYKGQVWAFYAHSIYYELLAETGIFGITIFALFTLKNLVFTIKLFKPADLAGRRKIYISLCLQIMFLIYGITGNCLYEQEQLLLYFLSYIIGYSEKRKIVAKRGIHENRSRYHP